MDITDITAEMIKLHIEEDDILVVYFSGDKNTAQEIAERILLAKLKFGRHTNLRQVPVILIPKGLKLGTIKKEDITLIMKGTN